MKIGFDAKRLFCNRTGLGNYSRTIVSNYTNYCPSDEIHLYSPKLGDIEDSGEFRLSDRYFRRIKNSFYWRSFKIVNDLKKDQIDIYHGLSNEIPFGIHKSGIKTIVTIHDLIYKIYPNTYPLFDRIIYDIKVRYACKYANLIIAISESTKKDLVKYYGVDESKVVVLYQAALPTYYRLHSSDELKRIQLELSLPNKFILSVGTIEERKNLKKTLEAYSQLKTKLPLIIIGGGKTYKEKIHALIDELEISQWVIFLPRKVSNEELKAIYQLATFSIYPSKYEGFGLPVLESQLCQTPVVTSNVSSLSEAGSNTSKKINPNNTKEILDAMEDFIESKSLKEESEEAFKYAIEKFNPKHLSNSLNKIYQELINK